MINVLNGFLPSGCSSPVIEKMPYTWFSLQAFLKTSTSGPCRVVVNSAHFSGWNPCRSQYVFQTHRNMRSMILVLHWHPPEREIAIVLNPKYPRASRPSICWLCTGFAKQGQQPKHMRYQQTPIGTGEAMHQLNEALVSLWLVTERACPQSTCHT